MKKNAMRVFLFLVFALCGNICVAASKWFEHRDCLQQQHVDIIKDYVRTAKLCGYSDELILKIFLNEAEKIQENCGFLTLSLEYDRKTVYWTIGIIGTVGLVALICTIYYYVTQANQAQVQVKAPVAPITPINPVAPVDPILPNALQDSIGASVSGPVLSEMTQGDVQVNQSSEGYLGLMRPQIHGEDDTPVDVASVILPVVRRSTRVRKTTDFYINHMN